MARYELTVKIVIDAESPDDATDGIAEILRPFEHPFDQSGNGMDWRFDGGPWRLTPECEGAAEAAAS